VLSRCNVLGRGQMFKAISLESHGYAPVRQLASSASASVLLVRRLSACAGLAEQFSDERFVVKSFVLSGLAAKSQRSVLQEIMLLKRLKHPHLIRYIESWWNGVGPCSGRLTVVMDHAEDGDLGVPRLAMERSGQYLQEGLVKRWLRQMLEGLAYMHNQNVVHRDLKASNVFLKDIWRTALLGDFGISTVLTSRVFANSCVGTPAYMAPETFRNEQCSTAVDMWGLGVILYELMALRRPFDGGNLLALCYQITFKSPEEASLIDKGYTATLMQLVRRLMSKDSWERPTAAQLLCDQDLWSNFSSPESELQALEAFACNTEACSPAAALQSTSPIRLLAYDSNAEEQGASSPDAVVCSTIEYPATAIATCGDAGADVCSAAVRNSSVRDGSMCLSKGVEVTASTSELLAQYVGPGSEEVSMGSVECEKEAESTARDLILSAAADDELREELLRTHQDDKTVSQEDFEALLMRLSTVPSTAGARRAASPTPVKREPKVKSPEDPLELIQRTELFLRRRKSGTSWLPRL